MFNVCFRSVDFFVDFFEVLDLGVLNLDGWTNWLIGTKSIERSILNLG